MKTAESIVTALPLPSQLRADSGAELKQKINALRPTHGDFMATPYKISENDHVAYLRA